MSDFLTRKFGSSEFITTTFFGVLIGSMVFFIPIIHICVSFSIVMNGYVLARTIFKLDRWTLRYWGFKSTEFIAFCLAQCAILATIYWDRPSGAILVYVLGINTAIYAICRGLVKKQIKTIKANVF